MFSPDHTSPLTTQLHAASRAYTQKHLYTFPAAATRSEEPTIPSPSLFTFTPDPTFPSAPSTGALTTFLLLLEVINALRARVIASTALDITFSLQTRHAVPKLPQRRLAKWTRYLAVAESRFSPPATPPTTAPPLHTLLLLLASPSTTSHLPWAAIHAAIDPRTLSYTPGAGAAPDLLQELRAFETLTLAEMQSLALEGKHASAPTVGVEVQALDRFAERMGRWGWVWSPALGGTFVRAVARWMEGGRGDDVELVARCVGAWREGEGRQGGEGRCLCWDCEMVRDVAEGRWAGAGGQGGEGDVGGVAAEGVGEGAGEGEGEEEEKQLRTVMRTVAYYRAVETVRRPGARGVLLPVMKEEGAWGDE
ncbi:hypothetical protein EDC01DRAFT_786480 [Geopyxis carbonaria]|nr:hypothetical protein EDC01DRAFT_786480 [Geopyxis carbonaria]